MSDLISIVIPVYNVKEYLTICLDAIINQIYTNIEIILVDDGSTDESGDICNKYKMRDKRIRVIHKNNGGLSDARNYGIRIAKGKYITFVDSDDYVEPNYISHLYKLLKENTADIVACAYKLIDRDNNIISKGIKDNNVEIVTENKMKSLFYSKSFTTTAWGKLYKTELFTKNDIRYPVGKYHEDVYTTYLLVDKANKLVISDKQYYNYRVTPGSITQSEFSLNHLDAIEASEIRRDFIIKKYPECAREANASIIYSCNQVIFRMIKAKYYDNDILKNIQNKYRLYIRDYILLDIPSIKGKMFATGCFISVRMMIKILGGKTK